MKRCGSVVALKPEKVEEYKRLHRDVWSGVLEAIHDANLRNYSIFLRQLMDGRHYLFSYFEYVGSDFEADMKTIADDPVTQEWWAVCVPCLELLPDRQEGEIWSPMEEVFHCE